MNFLNIRWVQKKLSSRSLSKPRQACVLPYTFAKVKSSGLALKCSFGVSACLKF